jgi:hypothetical protein
VYGVVVVVLQRVFVVKARFPHRLGFESERHKFADCSENVRAVGFRHVDRQVGAELNSMKDNIR